MNLFRDALGGWKARPLPFVASLLLCFVLSVLIGGGLLILEKSKRATESLLAAWPKDQCTLLVRSADPGKLTRELEKRLPPHHWLGIRIQNQTAWVTGTLPESFFQGQGHALSPKQIKEGDSVILLNQNLGETKGPGDIFIAEDQAFRIMGIGAFPLQAERVAPLRAKRLQETAVDSFLIQQPASELRPLVQDLLRWKDIQLIDHQEKQQQAKQGFQRLRRNFVGITLAVGLMVAILLQALYQSEIRERKSEFALRRSLGATPANIRNQILFEALIANALPAFVGYLFFIALLPALTLVLAFGFTLLWMLLCATLPAIQAASIPPGEALKGE